MKPIYNKTGLENLLELIKKDNPSAVITSEQILEVPISGVDPVSGRTTAVLTAKVDGGYSGQITIDWLRRSLEQYVTEGDFIPVLEGETEEDVKAKIAEAYSLVLSDLEFQGFSLPGLTENQAVVFSLQANEGLVYGETGSASLIISTVDITEGARGNGSAIRVTSTGLVRGIVEGAEGNGGGTPEPDNTEFNMFYSVDLETGLIESSDDPNLSFYNRYELDPVSKSEFNYVQNPLQIESGLTATPYQPTYFLGTKVAGEIDKWPVVGSLPPDNKYVPYMLSRPSSPVDFDIIITSNAFRAAGSHDFAFFYGKFIDIKFEWRWANLTEPTLDEFYVRDSQTNAIIVNFKTSNTAPELTIRIRNCNFETGHYDFQLVSDGSTSAVFSRQVQTTVPMQYSYVRASIDAGQDIAYTDPNLVPALQVVRGPYDEYVKVEVPGTAQGSRSGSPDLLTATYTRHVEAFYDNFLSAVVEIAPVADPEVLYFEVEIDCTFLVEELSNNYDTSRMGLFGTLGINTVNNPQTGAGAMFALGITSKVSRDTIYDINMAYTNTGAYRNSYMPEVVRYGIELNQITGEGRLYTTDESTQTVNSDTFTHPVPTLVNLYCFITGVLEAFAPGQSWDTISPARIIHDPLEWVYTPSAGAVSVIDGNQTFVYKNPANYPFSEEPLENPAPLRDIGIFVGGSANGVSTNLVTTIGDDGTLHSQEYSAGVSLTARAGSTVINTCLFYGGAAMSDGDWTMVSSARVDRIPSGGTLEYTSTSISPGRSYAAGLVGGNFYGGAVGDVEYEGTGSFASTWFGLNSSGGVSTYQRNISERFYAAACGVVRSSNFIHGGVRDVSYDLLIIREVLVGKRPTIQSSRTTHVCGSGAGDTALFYGGFESSVENGLQLTNKLDRLDYYGNTISLGDSVGTARSRMGSACLGTRAIFYGGYKTVFDMNPDHNEVTIMTADGTLLTSETTVGTARYSPAGAGAGVA